MFLLLQASQALNDNCITWDNSPALYKLKQAVYGSAAARTSLSELLYSASVQQVSLLLGLGRNPDTPLQQCMTSSDKSRRHVVLI